MMNNRTNADLPQPIDEPPAFPDVVTSSSHYGQQPEQHHQSNSTALRTTTLPPPYTPNESVNESEVDANYSSIVGKQSVWYHGVRYSTDELWKAALSLNFATVQKCLKAGLSVNYCRWVHDAISGKGVRSIADVVAANNDIRTMQLLIENKVDLTGAVVSVFATNKQSEARMIYDRNELEQLENNMWTTPLHEACRKGHVDMISVLLEHGGVNPHTMDHRQRTGLFIATKSRQTAVVQRLLLSGAAIESENSGGITPLASAAYAGSTNIVDLLLESGAKVDMADDRGETALYNASLMGHHDIVARLVAFGSDINVRNLAGTTAFFTAASRFKTDTMTRLVEYGADIDIPDANGCTVLLRAVMAKNITLLRLLLDLGADIDIPDERGWTPLFAAMIHGDELFSRLLLENGCNTTKPDLHGNTPLHQAAMLNSVTVVRYILAQPGTIDHTQVNVFGETPLTLASKYNNSGIVKLLLKHGADPTFIDPEGHTALDRAIYLGNYASVKLLITKEELITETTLISLQAGRIDHGPSTNYDMIVRLLELAHIDVPPVPKVSPAPELKTQFALAITRDELRARMRVKQRRPIAVNPETGLASVRGTDLEDPFETSQSSVAPANLNQVTAPNMNSSVNAVRTGINATNLAVNVASLSLGI